MLVMAHLNCRSIGFGRRHSREGLGCLESTSMAVETKQSTCIVKTMVMSGATAINEHDAHGLCVPRGARSGSVRSQSGLARGSPLLSENRASFLLLPPPTSASAGV